MGTALRAWVVCLPLALACDAIWLGVVARGFYRRHLGYLFGDTFVWGAALAFYLLHAAGLVYFVVLPGLRHGSLMRLLGSAVFFGLVTYGTYDLTNLATVRDWPRIVTVVDMLWGAALSTIVAFAGYLAGRS